MHACSKTVHGKGQSLLNWVDLKLIDVHSGVAARMGRAWLRPGSTPCVLATLLLAVVCHGTLAFDPSVWTLPPGFQVAEYFEDAVPNARQLAVSGASTAKGPVVTYVGALNFDGEPMSVRDLAASTNSLAWVGGRQT